MIEDLAGTPDARLSQKRVIDEQYGTYDRVTMDASLHSAEAREGWQAFAEKRAPDWIVDDLRPDRGL